MKRTRSPRQRGIHKIVVMGALLVGACLLTFYFHAALKQGAVFTHLFYVPIILACVWWRRKGYIVAAALVALLILSHVFLRPGIPPANDYTRSLMLMVIATAVILLRERIEKAERTLRESRDRLSHDITERKQAEEKLRDSERRHRALFESSRDALMTIAPPSWRFTSGNPAAIDMFETKDEGQFTSLGPWEVSPEFQPDGRPSAENAKEMIETAMRDGSHLFEWTHKRMGGEEFPTTVLLTRMDLGGQTLIQATVRDITERKRAEEAAASARQEAERRAEEIQKINWRLGRAVAEKNNFLRAVSHDLSAPLRNVAGMASFLKSRYADKLDDVGRDRLDRIMRNIKNQNRLIEDLLDLSRIKTRRGSFQQTDTAEMLREITEQFAFDLEENSGIVELQGEFPLIWCETNRMRQVFGNLIDNAIKYAHPDRPCRIMVTGSQDQSDYRFSLTDNGIGMRPEEAEKVFFVFQRAHNPMTTRISGRGVGLATVKSIIENYGGDIRVESRENEGSTFTFTLPKANVSRPSSEQDRTASAEETPSTDNGSDKASDVELLTVPKR